MFFTLQGPAYAYLDPGTGSMLLQILLGGVAGFMVVIRLYWHKIKTRLVPANGSKRSEQQDHSTQNKGSGSSQ